MAQPVILGAAGEGAPLPFKLPKVPRPAVSLRLETEPLDRLPHNLIMELIASLTNDERRGDHCDDGEPAGSHMRHVLDDFLTGYAKTGHWASVAYPLGSRHRGPLAWAMLEPDYYRTDAIKVGFYCDPAWRRKGLGRLLIDECVRLAHRLGHRRLVACPWNASSHAFFLGAGFTSVNHYGEFSGLSELEVPRALPPRPRLQCEEP